MTSSPYAAVVDPLFEAAGFQVTKSLGQRTITGTYAGRACRLLLSPQTRTRYSGDVRDRQYLGHRLHIEMEINARTRCGVFRRAVEQPWSSAIKRWLGARPVAAMPPALAHLACWGYEPDWAARWLEVPGTQDLLIGLFTPESSPHCNAISLLPTGRLALVIQHVDVRRIAPVRFERWLADLDALARTADAAPAPLRRLAPTRMEVFAERHPARSAIIVLVGLMAIVTIAGVLFSGTLIGLAMLLSR